MAKNEKESVQKLLDLAGIKLDGDNPGDIKVNNNKLFPRVLSGGSLALGESYMDGWWDADQMDEFFSKILSAELDKKIITPGIVILLLKSRLLNTQNKLRSKKVAEEHYDLGNDFYQAMLDKNMQYTCAYWKDADNLEDAQINKLDLICKKIGLKPGDTVLELGCGWGGFANYAAKNYGAQVTGYNISAEQVEYAKELNKDLPVEIIKADYREAKGKFDHVVSIGLCEHVGYKNYDEIMKVAEKALKALSKPTKQCRGIV